jgi:hypothetical protein
MLQQTETAAVMGAVEAQAMQVAQAQMAADSRGNRHSRQHRRDSELIGFSGPARRLS